MVWLCLAMALASEPLLAPVKEVRGGVTDAHGTFLSHRDLKRRYPDAPYDGMPNAIAAMTGTLGVAVGLTGLAASGDDSPAGTALAVTGAAMYVGGTVGALTFRFGRKGERVRMARAEGRLERRRQKELAATPPVPAPVVATPVAPSSPARATPRGAPAVSVGPACGVYHMAPGTERGLSGDAATAVDLVCRLSIRLIGIQGMGPRDADERFMALLGASALLPDLPGRCTQALDAVTAARPDMAVAMVVLPEACGPELGTARTQTAIQGWAAGRWQAWIDKARPHLLPEEANDLDGVWPLP